ncbi:hypothetical protein ACPA0O_01030 [Ectopseudomonas chengduensis]|nr:hypothetical protein [Pseudomonas sp. WS 5019]NMY14516.1 hypothetical protein [Pseudomonas sp. WS 5019]
MDILFRILLTLNATSLLILVFVAKEGIQLGSMFPSLIFLAEIPSWISYLAYMLIPVALTKIIILVSVFLPERNFERGSIIEIGHANNSFLPSYLGYFFVALSIPDVDVLIFVYTLLFLFTYLSQALYFNPLFLVFGFQFYNIKTLNGAELFLISKKSYKIPKEIGVSSCHSINDYTLMEGEK